MSTKGLILITGLNGYLAGVAAELAIKEGYDVRGTVRRLETGTRVKDALEKRGYPGKIEVVRVPVITDAGAFDEAVKGCTIIWHLASPVGGAAFNTATETVDAAVNGTTSILNSALKAGPQLKSFVVVSSTAAVLDLRTIAKQYDENNWNDGSIAYFKKKGDNSALFPAYMAAKTLAEKAFWKFRDEHKPSFGMSSTHPSWVIGPPALPWEDVEDVHHSTNQVSYYVLNGDIQPLQSGGMDDTIDVRDFGRILLWLGANPKAADGGRYIASTWVGRGQAVADILWKKAPELVQGCEKGTPGKGYKKDYSAMEIHPRLDASKIKKASGLEWIPYEESVVDTARAVVGLRDKSKI